ncbi:MAG TPA: hypothetical protein VFE82_09680 [Ramlibacter sp.]|jgi:hypothetical protein|uniref:hypothetical protein n=1 Tax=Ramlibacter sp. TaxID=1917967 RepID=UPI002D67F997|nr:hypothetical protein [Ramlibacter sp.]HZY18742.1 hypothetical protein [Ramlibacter sp.]
MIVVYWLEAPAGLPGQARHRVFPPQALGEALQFAEVLRRRRRDGEPLSHVSLQSELPESVGEAGVAGPSADYAHYKRRLDPSVPLGRPSGPAAPDGG